MAEYKALTRKYRPYHFEDIVSQEHVSNTLKNAIAKNRLSHAYMFCGPRGVGKTTMARVLARTINSVDDSIDGEALSNTLNIIEIDAASNNKVEDVHRIRETVRIPPQSGKYKIYIIDEVHMLTKQAFNALLKTLEEPPKHVIFIFATTEPHKVLPTILSRVQRFDFRRIQIDEIVSQLVTICEKEGIQIDNESLHVIAKKADGALRDALGLMDQAIAFCGQNIQHEALLQALNVVGTDRLFELSEFIKDHNSTATMHLVEFLMQEGYDIQEFLVSLTEHVRNLFFAKNSDNVSLIEASDETKRKYVETAKWFSEDDLMRMLHIASEGQISIKDAHQPRIHFEIILLKLVKMQRLDGLKALLKSIESNPNPSTNPSPSQPAKKSTESSNTSVDAIQRAREQLKAQQTSNKTQASATITPIHSFKSSEAETTLEVGKTETIGNTVLKTDLDSSHSENKEEEVNVERKTTLAFHDVVKSWNEFIEFTKSKIKATLVLVIQRCEPIDLESPKLILKTSDDFSSEILKNNAIQINQLLREYFEYPLELETKVEASNEKMELRDPYERFKKLQEKDPILRAVVDIFGAELDYNI